MNENSLLNKLQSLFTNNQLDTSIVSIEEDFAEVIAKYSFNVDKFPIQQNLDEALVYLNKRDSLAISIFKDGSLIENFSNTTGKSFTSYVDELKTGGLELNDLIEFKITIPKNKQEDIISIYSLEHFIKQIENYSFAQFLSIFKTYLGKSRLNLELQSDKIEHEFKTTTFSIINKSSAPVTIIIGEDIREKRINDARTLCHWDLDRINLLPEDLYSVIQEGTNIQVINLFQKVCLLYTCMFIFDYSHIKSETFTYKLNGYKTIGQNFNTSITKDIIIDNKSFETFFKIYHWIYNGGNTIDKISITRNILSLNFDPKTLELSESAFDAILSNFKIYERENVKQYIEVRNKLSELLIDLQNKIGKIVEDFVGDFKKNLITLISFFISVVALRVISKGDFIGGFTDEIIILSYSLLFISLGILLYSRWELKQKAQMFDKHYEQLKDRYKELLTEKEITEIFDDCNPQKLSNNKSFIYKQRKLYSWLWFISILVLAVTLQYIHYYNNLSLYIIICKILKSILYALHGIPDN
jgi:hypothetical protein